MAEYKVVDAEKLDADLSSVADAIRTKGGTSESLEFPQGFVNAVGAIESGGGGTEEIEQIIDQSGVLESTEGTVEEKVERLVDKAEWENVWYEASSKLKNAEGLFKAYKGITLPRTNLINVTTVGNLCTDNNGEQCTIEYVDYYINTQNSTSFGYMFRLCRNLKWLVGVNTKKATNVLGIFFYCTALETIQEPLDFSKVTNTNNAFGGCTALKNILFEPESINVSIIIPSSVLSIGNVFNLNDTENVGSVQSIINGLATLAEGAAAQTLTLSKNLPLTEEQKQAITTAVNNKGWTLAFA